MFYCDDATAYQGSFDSTKYCILEQRSWACYEIGGFIGRRNWCRNDADIVVYFQPHNPTTSVRIDST